MEEIYFVNAVGTWIKSFRQKIWNCILHLHKNVSRKILLSWIIYFLIPFSRCRHKVFGTFKNPIGGVVQIPFFASTGTCWGKGSLIEKVYKSSSILDSEQIKTRQVCQKCNFGVHSNIFKKKKLFSSGTFYHSFPLRVENLEAGCQTCFPGVEGNTIKWNLFLKRPFFQIFLPWVNDFRQNWGPQFRCPEKHYGDFREKSNSYHPFWSLSKSLEKTLEKACGRVFRTDIYVSRRVFWLKFCEEIHFFFINSGLWAIG